MILRETAAHYHGKSMQKKQCSSLQLRVRTNVKAGADSDTKKPVAEPHVIKIIIPHGLL